MKEELKMKCTEQAKILIPWANEILSYCPIHANKLIIIANATGNPIKAKLIEGFVECESNEIITEEEKNLNKTFVP